MKKKRRYIPWLLCGLLLCLLCPLLLRKEQEAVEPTGALDGRFSSSLTLEYQGQTLFYRENALTNLLFMGIDTTDPVGTTAQEGGQADFLLLLSADRENRVIRLLQLDRDTITPVQTLGIFGDPGGSVATQLCLAHAFGLTEAQRCENTVQAVENLLLGIPIHGYIALSIGDIAAVNEALGGVTVTLEDDFSQADPEMTPGKTLTLSGHQAEIFLRYRANVADGTNVNRMARQRVYLKEAEKILETAEPDGFLDALNEILTTDLNFRQLSEYESRWTLYEKTDIDTIPGTHTLGADGFVEFYPDADALRRWVAGTFFR